MSKSPNYLLPALGATGIALGAAYGMYSKDYGSATIASLQDQVAQVEARVADATTAASSAAEKAAAEAARAADLEARIAEVQAAASAAPAMMASQTAPAPATDGRLGLGRTALPEEIAAWDVDVLPGGRGLPPGSGDVFTGEEVFADRCGACHGDFAEGVDNWPVLAGGFDTLADEDPVKTVGSYWPHLSTAWDYISRSMPFGEAGTLTADETYAIVAYILYSNDLVDDDFELSHENFAEFDMYNMNGFVIDDRPDLEYADWRAEPCMANCKEEVSVTMRSVFLVEEPAEGGTNSVMNHATLDNVPSFTSSGAAFVPEPEAKPAETATVAPASTQSPSATGGGDDMAALVTKGEKVFKKCKACHEIGAGASNKSGPQLNGLFGRTMGSVDGFKYSAGFKAAMEDGRVWDEASLAEFLAKPKAYIKGTKMAFSGLKKDADQDAIAAYLKSASE